MIILSDGGPTNIKMHKRAIVLFGSGLIGGSIFEALNRGGIAKTAVIPVDWIDKDIRRHQLGEASRSLEDMSLTSRLDIVWAAGRAGFASSATDVAGESDAFSDVCHWVLDLRRSGVCDRVVFHMVSSAGGLFEGLRFVNNDTEPKPLRPYGELKLVQENTAIQVCAGIPLLVYRPSSVYGFAGRKGRLGLVTTLVMNAKTGMPSRIFGSLDTIRDYVTASDVGEFIARKTGSPVDGSTTFLLASGKPSSLGEIIALIGRILGRKLLLKLDPMPSNDGHMSYRVSSLPKDWHPTDLETGIRQVNRRLAQVYEAGARK
jgi:nucleoside-diphosphate-sugar epimerase